MSQNIEQIEAQLSAYIDGALDEPQVAEIEKHLAANPGHRELIGQLKQMRQWTQSLPRAKAPGDLGDMLQGQLERSVLLGDEEGEQSEVLFRINRWPQMLSAAAVLALAIGLGLVIYAVLPQSQPRQIVQAPTGEGGAGGGVVLHTDEAAAVEADAMAARAAKPGFGSMGKSGNGEAEELDRADAKDKQARELQFRATEAERPDAERVLARATESLEQLGLPGRLMLPRPEPFGAMADAGKSPAIGDDAAYLFVRTAGGESLQETQRQVIQMLESRRLQWTALEPGELQRMQVADSGMQPMGRRMDELKAMEAMRKNALADERLRMAGGVVAQRRASDPDSGDYKGQTPPSAATQPAQGAGLSDTVRAEQPLAKISDGSADAGQVDAALGGGGAGGAEPAGDWRAKDVQAAVILVRNVNRKQVEGIASVLGDADLVRPLDESAKGAGRPVNVPQAPPLAVAPPQPVPPQAGQGGRDGAGWGAMRGAAPGAAATQPATQPAEKAAGELATLMASTTQPTTHAEGPTVRAEAWGGDGEVVDLVIVLRPMAAAAPATAPTGRPAATGVPAGTGVPAATDVPATAPSE